MAQSIQELPAKLLARYIRLTEVMMETGPNIGMPHTKALKHGLFEMRLKAVEGIVRVFYVSKVEKEIVILHSYVKKKMKIPLKELRIARSRLKEVSKHAKER